MSQLKNILGVAEIELTGEEITRISEVTEPLNIYPNWMVERINEDRNFDLTIPTVRKNTSL